MSANVRLPDQRPSQNVSGAAAGAKLRPARLFTVVLYCSRIAVCTHISQARAETGSFHPSSTGQLQRTCTASVPPQHPEAALAWAQQVGWLRP
mmetsp:Transcript_62587/g.139388  ORF Transcript_62587/g.139388 Transcript_62587/m.139388 type:complete len:93 (-) Transcript_62587:280-558(-)